MNSIRKLGLGAAAAVTLGLGACASTPLYAPQVSESGSGYADQQIDQNQYRVTFSGRRSTTREEVEAGLLLRAAEVTRGAGYTYFLVANRETDQERRPGLTYAGGPGLGMGFGFGYGRGWYPYRRWGLYDPFWYDVGWYYDEDRNTRYVASADIALLSEGEARGNPQAIQASDVISTLSPQFAPPPPR